jgi:YD repeat-containing protein
MGFVEQGQGQFGQSLSFTYDSTGKIATITLPDSNITRYGYDADGRLATVTWPDGKVRSYHYEDAQSSGALTGITDEAGVRFATWTYDAQGRATSSEHAGGVDKVQVQYLSKSQSVITAADGSSRTYSLELAGNVLRPTGVSAPCPECGNVAKTTAYDASGNVSRRVDFSNQETRYIYDAQGRETQRIEAYGTANAQTTTTEWHPTWRLPTKIASPGRVDYFTYDPKGQPSGYAWFPTNDANGSQGLGATPSGAVTSTGWTYDANGLVSATVEMVGDAVTGQWYFTYDAQGNLLTLTDSDGNVGRALQYDAAGRLLEAINSDGERVRYQYNARGSWTAYEADGRVTNYEYDANGFLTAVRGPGSYYEGYEYDAAHRLTAILRPTTAPQSVDTSNPFGPRATNSPTLPDTEQVQGTWASLWTWLKEWLASWIPSAIAQAGWQRILVPAWPSKSQAPSNAPTSPADELQEGAGIRQNPNTLLQQFDKSLRELATRATEALTCDEDPRCTQARKEASSAYHDLQYKRLPQYLNGGTNGADAGHRNAIIGKQNSLRKAIKKVKLYCATALPLELPEWERVANMEIPILY